ncbi:MAG: hypothetical protein LQ342_001907 [Letrouitia transgressa]|nr:MAG: hypothetical protein LQ342_001907 [Letrouitia transgressa]
MSSPPNSNPHLSDPLLHPFLNSSFSPIAYLNSTLPVPPPASKLQPQQQQPTLSTLSAQTQSHISTLNAQTTRLSSTLTALTDDILRCGHRLIYEVELLRGEANTLAENLSSRGTLATSLQHFVPPSSPPTAQNGTDHPQPQPQSPLTPQKPAPAAAAPPALATEPPELDSLRTLLRVRAALLSTTRIFSLALAWPMPPSLLTSTTSSLASNLISVSAPPQSSDTPGPDLEQQGQEALAKLRAEVEEMLLADDGLARARARVQELKECVGVWKGTGEEKARMKWVEGLEGWVEEVGRKKGGGWTGAAREGGVAHPGGVGGREEAKSVVGMMGRDEGRPSSRGPGFLRRLRDEIYME